MNTVFDCRSPSEPSVRSKRLQTAEVFFANSVKHGLRPHHEYYATMKKTAVTPTDPQSTLSRKDSQV